MVQLFNGQSEKWWLRKGVNWFLRACSFRSTEKLQEFSAARWAAAYIHMNIKAKQVWNGVRCSEYGLGIFELGQEDLFHSFESLFLFIKELYKGL